MQSFHRKSNGITYFSRFFNFFSEFFHEMFYTIHFSEKFGLYSDRGRTAVSSFERQIDIGRYKTNGKEPGGRPLKIETFASRSFRRPDKTGCAREVARFTFRNTKRETYLYTSMSSRRDRTVHRMLLSKPLPFFGFHATV